MSQLLLDEINNYIGNEEDIDNELNDEMNELVDFLEENSNESNNTIHNLSGGAIDENLLFINEFMFKKVHPFYLNTIFYNYNNNLRNSGFESSVINYKKVQCCNCNLTSDILINELEPVFKPIVGDAIESFRNLGEGLLSNTTRILMSVNQLKSSTLNRTLNKICLSIHKQITNLYKAFRPDASRSYVELREITQPNIIANYRHTLKKYKDTGNPTPHNDILKNITISVFLSSIGLKEIQISRFLDTTANSTRSVVRSIHKNAFAYANKSIIKIYLGKIASFTNRSVEEVSKKSKKTLIEILDDMGSRNFKINKFKLKVNAHFTGMKFNHILKKNDQTEAINFNNFNIKDYLESTFLKCNKCNTPLKLPSDSHNTDMNRLKIPSLYTKSIESPIIYDIHFFNYTYFKTLQKDVKNYENILKENSGIFLFNLGYYNVFKTVHNTDTNKKEYHLKYKNKNPNHNHMFKKIDLENMKFEFNKDYKDIFQNIIINTENIYTSPQAAAATPPAAVAAAAAAAAAQTFKPQEIYYIFLNHAINESFKNKIIKIRLVLMFKLDDSFNIINKSLKFAILHIDLDNKNKLKHYKINITKIEDADSNGEPRNRNMTRRDQGGRGRGGRGGRGGREGRNLSFKHNITFLKEILYPRRSTPRRTAFNNPNSLNNSATDARKLNCSSDTVVESNKDIDKYMDFLSEILKLRKEELITTDEIKIEYNKIYPSSELFPMYYVENAYIYKIIKKEQELNINSLVTYKYEFLKSPKVNGTSWVATIRKLSDVFSISRKEELLKRDILPEMPFCYYLLNCGYPAMTIINNKKIIPINSDMLKEYDDTDNTFECDDNYEDQFTNMYKNLKKNIKDKTLSKDNHPFTS